MADQNESRRSTYPPQQPRDLAPVVERNVRALYERRQREAESASWQERVAEVIGRFAGSMIFVYLHLFIVMFWIAANLGWIPGIPAWDEILCRPLPWLLQSRLSFSRPSYSLLRTASAAAADRRADLDLQISLLSEHEITKLAELVSEIGAKLGVKTNVEQQLEEIKRDVAPDAVLDEIETRESD